MPAPASSRSTGAARSLPNIKKTPTGIPGFDEITFGGLPRGRPTLVCGAAGCGKTLFGMQFLVRGVLDYREPGVFVAFEERESDLVQNVASLGIDLQELVEKKLIALDHVRIERTEIEESGEYDLEGLFLRLDLAINAVKAKRVVIDTLETIFGGLSNYAILRSELRRLFTWLKDRGVTTVVTAERGEGALTRHGLEEYVSDCVVVLDHRVDDQISTRRVRIVKYRGSTHGTNEYPFLIDSSGITVVPITGSTLAHKVSTERVSSGIPQLDQMLGGGGYYRGSTALISGTAGAGKSSICAHFADASCRRKERCLYVAYEESPEQIIRNMGSIGLPLADWVQQGKLKILAQRPTSNGFEGHLALIHRALSEFQPKAVVLDPIGTITGAGDRQDAHLMVVRLIDLLKSQGITVMLSSLTHGNEALEYTAVAISSLVDTWLLVKAIESNGERNRGMYVLKSRGMAHSNQIREFNITSQGVQLIEPYIGLEGVLTGTARLAQESREKAARIKRLQETEQVRRLLQRKRLAMEQQVASLQAEFEAQQVELLRSIADALASESELEGGSQRVAEMRGANRSELEIAPASRSNGKRPRGSERQSSRSAS